MTLRNKSVWLGAALFALALVLVPQAQAFTLEKQGPGDAAANYADPDKKVERFGTSETTTVNRNGFWMQMQSSGASNAPGPSDRNANDVAPRYSPPSGFR